MPTFHHDDIEFHYLDTGAGWPFVFQHGLGGDVTQPAGLFQPPPGVRLLAFDARGHGQTRPLGDPAKLTFAVFAQDLRVFLERLGVSRVVLGGTSMGAALALHFALRWPEQVQALVLSRPAWLEEPCPWNVQMFTFIAGLIQKHGAARGLLEFQQTPQYLEAREKWPDTAQSLCLQFQKPRSEETAVKLERLIRDRPHPDRRAWASLQVPALVLGNHLDPIHPFEFAEELARQIPGADLQEITSKSISVAQHNADVQHALETFLARLRPRP